MKPSRSKKAKTAKGKFSFVFLIGDEGTILLQFHNNKVLKRIFAQSPEKDHVRTIDELLTSYPKAPITILVDMMDQSYVRQTLPPVSSFNVSKIVRRRLNKDFSTDDIKGYIIFGRDKKGRKDWNYLMASLANTPLLQKWIDIIIERPNPLKGIGLIPLESQPLIQAIEAVHLAKAGKDAKPTEWHILISHHKVGGFRQIVLRNGQLVFTRLAQLVGEPTPEVIAGNIEQEMLNTFEYLKRLGLQDLTTLTATIMASGEIKQVFDPQSMRVGKCYFYTPHELAELLGMKDMTKPEDHFGDVLVAAFIGQRRKLLLPLFTTYSLKIFKITRTIKYAHYAAGLMVAGIFTWAGFSGVDLLGIMQESDTLDTTRKSLESQYQAEVKKNAALPQKINTYSDVSSLFKYFFKPASDPLYFVNTLLLAIHDIALIKSYHWSLTPTIASSNEVDKRQISVEFESYLTAPSEPREPFVASARKLVENIKTVFPDYDVVNSDLPGILSDSKELRTVISDNDSDSASITKSDTISTMVKFSLKGPLKDAQGNIITPAANRRTR